MGRGLPVVTPRIPSSLHRQQQLARLADHPARCPCILSHIHLDRPRQEASRAQRARCCRDARAADGAQHVQGLLHGDGAQRLVDAAGGGGQQEGRGGDWWVQGQRASGGAPRAVAAASRAWPAATPAASGQHPPDALQVVAPLEAHQNARSRLGLRVVVAGQCVVHHSVDCSRAGDAVGGRSSWGVVGAERGRPRQHCR